MAIPPATAMENVFTLSMLGRSRPMKAQTTRSVIAPKRQRQNTTPVTGCPDIKTNQPIVPEISMAAVISIVPRLISFIALAPACWSK